MAAIVRLVVKSCQALKTACSRTTMRRTTARARLAVDGLGSPSGFQAMKQRIELTKRSVPNPPKKYQKICVQRVRQRDAVNEREKLITPLRTSSSWAATRRSCRPSRVASPPSPCRVRTLARHRVAGRAHRWRACASRGSRCRRYPCSPCAWPSRRALVRRDSR